MIRLLFTLIFCFFLLSLSAQAGIDCKKVRYDTLNCNFIRELDGSTKFYSVRNVMVQNDAIYIDNNVKKKIIPKMYNSDTIIVTSASGSNNFSFLDNCSNMLSISSLFWQFNLDIGPEKKVRILRKNIFTDSLGNRYLRFSGKLIVADMGKYNWFIPKIYSLKSDNNCTNAETYCEKFFGHTLVITNVLDIRFQKQ